MFKFAGVGKKGRLLLATGLCFLLILGTVLFSPVLADEVNDVNPELKFVHIEGDSDKYYADGSYTASGSFNQGDGKYEMTTNSFVAWYLQDDIAFAYKTYNIGNTEDDVITGETQIDYFDAQFKVDADGNTLSPEANASAGIMIRSGLEPNAAFVFMHVRPTRIMIVYRVRSGGNMGVSYTSFSPVYPVQLKIEKRGNVVTPSFKTKDMTDWFSISAVGMETDGSKPIYMGLNLPDLRLPETVSLLLAVPHQKTALQRRSLLPKIRPRPKTRCYGKPLPMEA